MDKSVGDISEAIRDVGDGATVALTGFGLSKGIPSSLIVGLRDKGSRNLTIVCNSLGSDGQIRAQMLVQNGQVARLVCSFSSRPGLPTRTDSLIERGEIAVELVPQGVLVERLRAAGAGLAAIYCPTTIGTALAEGKEVRAFKGRNYVLETALPVDFAFCRAWRADKAGNVQFRGSNIHFNSCMAKAATTSIVEVDEIVEIGEIPSEDIDLPGIFISRVVQNTVPVDTSRGTVRLRRPPDVRREYAGNHGWTRLEMAQRVLELIPDDSYVNVGSGMPALIAKMISDHPIVLHGENGILGYAGVAEGADADPDLFDAGGNSVLTRPGASFFDSVTSFELARSGRLAAVVLGGYQVDARRNLANYSLGNVLMGGVGGAMDLIAGRSLVIVMMEHRDSKNRPKLLRECTLPLTGAGCVDTVVTDVAVLRWDEDMFAVERVAEGFTFNDVRGITEMPLRNHLGQESPPPAVVSPGVGR